MPLNLVKGTGERARYGEEKLHISTRTTDLYVHFPLLLSSRPKRLEIDRTNMLVCIGSTLSYLSEMLRGQGHTLILRGLTAECVLNLLGHLTKQGVLGHTIIRLEMYIKGHSKVSYPLHLGAMNKLCGFIAQWFPSLKHLVIVKTPFRLNAERVWTKSERYVQSALDLMDMDVEEVMPDYPVYHGLETLVLDYPELDTNQFFQGLMKFDRLEHLVVKRIHPVFVRRNQVITTLLEANWQTLRSVDIDFGVSHYQLARALSEGVQELRLASSVVASGLTIRINNRAALKNIDVVVLDTDGKSMGEVDLADNFRLNA
jgi:hypothetical protein